MLIGVEFVIYDRWFFSLYYLNFVLDSAINGRFCIYDQNNLSQPLIYNLITFVWPRGEKSHKFLANYGFAHNFVRFARSATDIAEDCSPPQIIHRMRQKLQAILGWKERVIEAKNEP